MVAQLRENLTRVEEDNRRKNTLLSEIRRRLTGVAEREADLEEVIIEVINSQHLLKAYLVRSHAEFKLIFGPGYNSNTDMCPNLTAATYTTT